MAKSKMDTAVAPLVNEALNSLYYSGVHLPPHQEGVIHDILLHVARRAFVEGRFVASEHSNRLG